MSTNQPPSIKNLLVRLTKVICSVLQELSKRPEGAYYISKEEIGGSCQSIKVLIGNFQQCKPESMEHYIGNFDFFKISPKLVLELSKNVSTCQYKGILQT